MAKSTIMDTQELYELEWEEMREQVDYLTEEFRNMLHRYEERYGTEVVGYALAGTVGLWNGTRIGGKGVAFDDIFRHGDYDAMEVFIDEKNVLTIKLSHHDGSHYMNVFFLTERKLKDLHLPQDGTDYWDYKDFENLYENGSPVKVDKLFKEAFGLGGKGK